jgi:tyrosyl-tRNA synthetase
MDAASEPPNTTESVMEYDLLAFSHKRKRVYAGYEPSGEIYIGHLVTLKKWWKGAEIDDNIR